jgi:hypothetical protein
MFSRRDETGFNQSKAFKKTFSVDVKIDFLGVWSVALPFANASTFLIFVIGIPSTL